MSPYLEFRNAGGFCGRAGPRKSRFKSEVPGIVTRPSEPRHPGQPECFRVRVNLTRRMGALAEVTELEVPMTHDPGLGIPTSCAARRPGAARMIMSGRHGDPRAPQAGTACRTVTRSPGCGPDGPGRRPRPPAGCSSDGLGTIVPQCRVQSWSSSVKLSTQLSHVEMPVRLGIVSSVRPRRRRHGDESLAAAGPLSCQCLHPGRDISSKYYVTSKPNL